ncbi:MAG: hypothetical protein KKD86_03495 [Bacteroidetes bacterium]|nr:hypothetical protein [Bacteroidota bacterium]
MTTLQHINFTADNNRQRYFGKAVFAILCKIKSEAKQPYIAAHLQASQTSVQTKACKKSNFANALF